MTRLQDIIVNALGTGATGYGIAVAWQTVTQQTFVEAIKEPKTLYAAGITVAATMAYTTLDRMINGARKYS